MCTKRESCLGIRLRCGVYREAIGTCFYLRLNELFIRAVRDILPYRRGTVLTALLMPFVARHCRHCVE